MEDRPLSEICSFCDVKLRSHFEYEAHIMGQRHRYEVRKKIVKEEHFTCSQGRPLPRTEYNCRICYTTYLGASSYFDHLVTRHKRKSPSRETEIKVCRICNIEYRDRLSFNEHLKSLYHRQAIEYRKVKREEHRAHLSRSDDGRHSSRDYHRSHAASSRSRYKCHLCGSVQRSQDFLEFHLRSEHPHASSRY